MTGKEVKAILKAAGIDSRKVSVRVTPSSYNVTLKSWSISRSEVEKALKHLEEIRRCEATGEILSGCNTFVFVDYRCQEDLPAVLIESAKAQKWAWTNRDFAFQRFQILKSSLSAQNPAWDEIVCSHVIRHLLDNDAAFAAQHSA